MGISVESELLCSYFKSLVNKFFKILPMRENSEETLTTYMLSLQAELLGLEGLIADVGKEPQFLTLLSMLQYMIDNPNCGVSETKRQVFRAISICERLQLKFGKEEVGK